MSRCQHGFEPTAVKCPVGCHGPVAPVELEETTRARLVQRARSVSNAQIVKALKARGSLNGAAVLLGIDPQTITNRSRGDAAIRAALDQRDRRKHRHSGFVDMTGQVIQGWTVLREAKSVTGNVCWECQHSCGGVEIIEGIKLRKKPNKYCQACRPKRAGTVTRRAS